MDGLPIPPLAASVAGTPLAVRHQDEQQRARAERDRRRVPSVTPPATVVGAADDNRRERRNPQNGHPGGRPQPPRPLSDPPQADKADPTQNAAPDRVDLLA